MILSYLIYAPLLLLRVENYKVIILKLSFVFLIRYDHVLLICGKWFG
jgi:hypothetical protein